MRYNILFSTVIISTLLSCRTEEGCKKIENSIKEENYHLVLSAKPEKNSGNGTWFYEVKGKDLDSNTDTIIHLDNYRWYESFYYLWDKGDTLVKAKGSLITEIHKKDTIYHMQWDCEDPKLNGISTKFFKPPKGNNH
ncbi:hypothetical protein SAMN05421741_1204 [Paenimyroides ummariense]|uniref:Lipoprotein n=1 Tax=Paenimyroides ummariense TaxID=913024 RepID=A0A1I5EDC8_9FLAO|nr:hypothetical protein [Paenimyroides ummariense]SFO09363.1 hypothetical protein SAMN05421741_1204 [Paenimyroides ummariense]